MKIVIIGGTGLIGRPLLDLLRKAGHKVVAASPSGGIDALTGAGLAEALAGASVVIDVSNAPSFEDEAALSFFRGTTTNIVAASREAGIGHIVALSVVGTDRLQASGYFRAKLAQEQLIAAAQIHFTIVRATQFFEFLATIADGYTRDNGVYLPSIALQPVAAGDISAMLAEVAITAPADGIVEVAGPERAPLAEFTASWLGAHDDPRRITVTADRDYFGAPADDAALVPGSGARIMPTRFDAWLHATTPEHAA
ncbi:SDR family oxidoreductase [Sphingomonas dokdonensis]|uniref:NmrA-like family protein n=1 Tax=Sphingomonas dokdonensis TaxID=344880 RepID=A0A245ZNH5_9SPHN|nr:SDR family oxidoreductase [Sphingomonas dokdonensis]OWK31304.1 NmrA-like family protein [Sphingomonas dokdonensis]